jgi:hypothetical protein
MPNYCHGCGNWEKVYDHIGHCTCPLARSDIKIEHPDNPADTDSEFAIFTKPFFGCVHWTFKGMKPLIDLDSELDQSNEQEDE